MEGNFGSMIIGSGLIGTAFRKLSSEKLLNEFIVFASGVSNSSQSNYPGYDREKELLLKTIQSNNLPIIYFSSILSPISDLPYYKHKLSMEKLIQEHSKEHLIFRIPQIVGYGGNENSLFNFLKESISSGRTVNTNETVERSIVDVDDLVRIVDWCKNYRGILSLSKIEKISVMSLCELIGKKLNKQPIINITKHKEFGDWCYENSDTINEALKELNIHQDKYTERLVGKYI